MAMPNWLLRYSAAVCRRPRLVIASCVVATLTCSLGLFRVNIITNPDLIWIVREGRDAMLNPPGSYCAYASVYLTVCLIRIFGLATKTYLEQQLHVGIIQEYMDNLASVATKIKVASFPSGLKKERGQPSSPAASLAGARDGGGTKPKTGPAATATATAGTTAVAAVASTSSAQSQQNALALARVTVTGTSALGIGAGGSCRRDGLDGGSAAAGGGGGDARHTSSGASGGVGRGTGGQGVDDGGALCPGQDAMRRMIVHINTLDPYPCVLGVPVKPALFATSKVYVFVCFAVISVMLMYDVVCDMV